MWTGWKACGYQNYRKAREDGLVLSQWELSVRSEIMSVTNSPTEAYQCPH